MTRTLFPHQQDALAWAEERMEIALFMEMRLGKTTSAIRWCEGFTPPYLVVAPLSVLPAWEKELLLEGVDERSIVYLGEKRGENEKRDNARWYLVNYEKVRLHPEFLDSDWRAIVLDESTRIRNPQAQITRILLERTSHIQGKAILSGLPAPESPMDYFSQFKFLYGNFLGFDNFWQFRKSLFATDAMGWDWYPKKGVLGRIHDEVHSKAFVLTRKQAGIGSKKIYETRTVDMTSLQKRVYKKTLNDFVLELNDGQELTTKWATVKLLWLARIAGGFSAEKDKTVFSPNKVNELLELLKTELHGEPVVIWFRFNAEIEAVHRTLNAKGVKHRHILGETTLAERKLFSQQFNRGDFDVLLCQVKCAKFGVDFSRASTAIYYSNSYDYEDRAQSEDRILHPQKTEPLLYIDLVSKGTVDEDVVEILRDKSASSKVLLSRLMEGLKRG